MLQEARDKGDLSENAEYDAAKEYHANVMNKIAPNETNFTTITICKAIIKSGNRRNEFCGRPTCLNDFCGYHKPKEKSNIYVKPLIKPESKFASTYVTNLFKNSSTKNKIVPIGGKKIEKQKNKKKQKKIEKQTKEKTKKILPHRS